MQSIKEKQMYNAPKVEKIVLDNEISLALESVPPGGPGEAELKVPDYFKNGPFKNNIC
jgi:hypothetical protein